MDNDTATHPRGFLGDDSTGVSREERIKIAYELGRTILSRKNRTEIDVHGKDAILSAFIPSTKYSKVR